MKHNLLKSVIISVILLLGANSVWAGQKTIFLKPNSNWTQSNAWFSVYCFNNGEEWVKMTDNDGDGTYECMIDDKFTSIIFCRMNSSASSTGWSNVWNQTNDLTITSGKDLYTVASGAWSNGSGTWSAFTLSANKTIYLKPNDDWKSDGARFAVYAFNASGNKWYDVSNLDCNGDYYSCTIDKAYHTVIFCRMNGSNSTNKWENVYNQTGNIILLNNSKNTDQFNITDWGAGSWGTYSAPTYTITTNHGTGGTISVSPASPVAVNTSVTVTMTPSTGYTFKSGTIKIGNNAQTTISTTTSTHTICGPTTINAQWTPKTYTVTLNPQSGTGGTTSVTATYGSAMPEITKPTRTGYTFNGYYDATSGGTQYYKADGSSARTWNKTAATTLYAQWTANQYTITYKDQNNANFSGSHASGYPTKHTYGTATTLKTASKTGYTFDGWFTSQDCSGSAVTTLGATAYTSNITLYAKWTINQYTLTYSAGEGGSVTGNHASGAKLNYNTSITLTATPTEGYGFVQWINNNGTQLSTANPYTFNLTADKTVKAEFAQPTNVYLKPTGFWTQSNARFAIYTWENGKEDQWVEMQPMHCDKQYYSANIPVGYTNFKYVRLDPEGKGNANKNNGLHWDYKWNETENLTMQPDVMYTIARLYLKPNNNWKQGEARFAAYFWNSSNADNEKEWVDMYQEGDYYYCDVPQHYYNKVIFCRMDPSKAANDWANKWDQTNDLDIPTSGTGLYTIADNAWSNGDGQWSTYSTDFNPTYPVTLDPHAVLAGIDFGSYSVRCNGTTYTSHPTEYVTFYAPAGAQIEILGGKPKNDAYYARTRAQQGGASGEIVGNDNVGLVGQTIEVCGSVSIDNWFLTKDDHIVYLGIPTSGNAFNKWNANNGDGYYIWAKDSPFDGLVSSTGEPFVIGNIKYYTFIMPAGTRNIQFQRKGSSTSVSAKDLPYQIPTTNVNCFTLTSENDGYWDMLPTQEGDYRLLYVEQVVEKDADGYTVITRKKAHPSDIIRKGTASQIVSLHTYKERTYTANAGGGSTYTSSNNPEIILQKYLGNDQWQDVECQMVYGPIETIPVMGQLPGRKNASPGSDIDDLKYHNGIENIKNDTHEDQGNGVWNFVVTQDNAGNASVQWNQTHRYEGKYYIRTDVANGGWNNYTAFDNYMTFSSYSKNHRDFSHYFCRWILQGTNVKFTIANDYGCAISDTLDGDSFVPKDGAYKGTLSENANVRFSWNQVTNNIYRAYIRGAYDPSTHDRLENIVATYKKESGGTDNEVILDDSGNWIYQKDITDVKVGSTLESLVAEYRDVVQTFEDDIPMLTGGESDKTYTVRILYDFKIDKTLITLVPNDKEADISIDVLIERVDQGPATQVRAAINAARTIEGSTVYAVMSFTKDHIENTTTKTEWERLYYWVSFPFDVRISEVFGFGEYGEHWIMEYYDGAERAKNGCWIDSPTYWRYITDTTGTEWTNGVLKANKGYVLALTRDIADLNIFQHTEQVSLYFPSTELITDIDANVIETHIELEPFTCTIERNNRKIYDSNWHVIGIPSYANKDQTLKQNDLFYFYTYETSNNTYSVTTADPRDGEETESNSVAFKSMHSYMVQFAGKINWRNEWQLNALGLAAKKTDSEYQTHSLRLELQQNGMQTDKTFIKLQDKDGITDEFDLNIDLTKIINSGANIYTIAGKELIQLAGNVLPVGEAIIPLGIQLDAAGEYTFAMPDGTDGITVELIDYENNTRTNMLLDDYTVNLTAGTNEARFALHVKPDKTATGVENITTPSHSDVRKFIIDGVLYMQKDGILYDAQGHIVR